MLRVAFLGALLAPASWAQERTVALADAELFVPKSWTGKPAADVILHLHGSPKLAREQFAAQRLDAVLITWHRDGRSGVYAAHWREPERFGALLTAAEAALSGLEPKAARRAATVTVSAFSAGYGGVRELLGQPAARARIDALVLADGLHASYDADQAPDAAQLAPFVEFAREAALGRKRMLVSHTAIVPGAYASTTECADALLRAVGLRREEWRGCNGLGMAQTSLAERGGLIVLGFAGTAARDHVQHFQFLWRLVAARSHIGERPPPPNEIAAQRGEQGVVLVWSAGARQAFRVYRSDSSRGPWAELTSSPIADRTFVDATLPAAAPASVCYTLTAVDPIGRESLRSQPVTPR